MLLPWQHCVDISIPFKLIFQLCQWDLNQQPLNMRPICHHFAPLKLIYLHSISILNNFWWYLHAITIQCPIRKGKYHYTTSLQFDFIGVILNKKICCYSYAGKQLNTSQSSWRPDVVQQNFPLLQWVFKNILRRSHKDRQSFVVSPVPITK